MTLDPERLLWVPGKKLVSIPAVAHGIPLKYLKYFDGIEHYYLAELYGRGLILPALTVADLRAYSPRGCIRIQRTI